MQSLGVAARLLPGVLDGAKTHTIRWREAPVAPGSLRLVSDGPEGQSVVVQVTRVTEMALSRAAAFVGRAEDWPDPVMLEGMREHYPAIELSSTVSVIEFEPPE